MLKLLSACLCSGASKGGFLCFTGIRMSLATRLYYVTGFIFSTALAFCLQTWGSLIIDVNKQPKENEKCNNAECWSYLVVMRVGMALVLYHTILCLSVFAIRSSAEQRAQLQNKFWLGKFVLWLTLNIISIVYIPESAFLKYHLAAITFAGLFIFYAFRAFNF